MRYSGQILDNGLGSKDRRAALVAAMREAVKDAHGNSETGKALAAILADAETRHAERMARKAARQETADAEPVKPRKVESDGTDASDAPSKPRKARKPSKATGKDAGKVGQRQCIACRKPGRTGGTDHGEDGWTCDACDSEAAE